ncbi:rapid alkalinization factor [Malania oleifera]|uniref:rapid alkalinization factor n=1 Tax=Malania oleifera TaxID=397392 RepID=UPI0025ADC3CF|nr:rapid alkalinization factor [Malania oleifera]
MGFRSGLIIFLLIVAMVAESSSSFSGDASWDLARFGDGGGGSSATCSGLVGDCVDADEEMMMESEAARRILGSARRRISYDALQRDRVPCSRRGRSYYNCRSMGRANPYRRGCSYITRCSRYNN